MRHLVELSGESKELAMAEALAVGRVPGEAAELDGRALMLDCGTPAEEMVARLALAWSVSRHLFSCRRAELEPLLDELELPGKTFRVRTSRMGDSHGPGEGSALARHAGEILSKRYKVNLEEPDVELRILMGKSLHAGILCGEVDRSALESRKPENRPFNHPISLHPKLARALVNLTRAEKGQALLDPFCGTGGILLEAGFMGCTAIGGDMDPRMVEGALLNLAHYGIRNHDVRLLDVGEWTEAREPVDAIATDPPYGRSASTAKEPIESLYARAFAACHVMLKDGGRLAIVLPAEKHISLAGGFKLEGMFPVRVHRSLTRYFCLFEK